MNTLERQTHWQNVYETKGERDVSWFQANPTISLDLIHATKVSFEASIIDIGGGTSRLVDALLGEGFTSITVLDVSEKALATSRKRLGSLAERVEWIVADVSTWRPEHTYDVWHDRAAFHFLTDANDRIAYAECVHKAVRPGGHLIIGTFAPDGPERWLQRPPRRPIRCSLAGSCAGSIVSPCRNGPPRSSDTRWQHTNIPV